MISFTRSRVRIRVRRIVLAHAAAIAAVATTGATASALPATAPPAAIEHAPTPFSDGDALDRDIAATAKARGWTVEQARVNHEAAEEVGRVAQEVAATRPNAFVGSSMAADPTGPPTLYVKGRADAHVRGLVSHASVPIRLVDDEPYSLLELDARARQLHNALRAVGYKTVTTSSGVTRHGVAEAFVAREPGLPDDARQILPRLPASLRDAVTLRVGEAVAGRDEHAYGGLKMYDTSGQCTSGWSVYETATGYTGVSTAGHCSTMDWITEPSEYSLAATLQDYHRGSYGDMAWFTTTHSEPAQFLAGPSDLRRVTALEARASITVGETVCLHRRMINAQDCTSSVKDTSVECTNSNVYNNNLVLMDAVVSEGGDSGGPWYYGYKAFGSHKGTCPDVNGQARSAFTVADLYDDAMGVRVRLSYLLPSRVALLEGDKLVSTDNRFTAIIQNDGNFVIYQSGVGAIWSTGTNGNTGARITLQSDGNLVVRRSDGFGLWSSGTNGSGATKLVMQTDGNLVLYGSSAVWSSGTCCR